MRSAERTLGLLIAIVFAFALIGCAGNRTHESTGQYIDDSTITTKVKTNLAADEGLKGLEIHVVTFKGIVQLSGFVDNESQIPRAIQIAQSVDGVRKVENKLTIKGQQ